MQQPGDQIWNGGTGFEWGKGTTSPAGDGPVFIVRIRFILVCNLGLFEIT